VAVLSAAGGEVAQHVLAETQPAILPLVPQLDTLFGAAALGGNAVTIYPRLDDWTWNRALPPSVRSWSSKPANSRTT
jgi:zinc D-Ala-D-Ala carboxypeptidase